MNDLMKNNIKYFPYRIPVVLLFVVSTSCFNMKVRREVPQILSYKELGKKDYDIPYILEFKRDNKYLVVYGCRHSFDPGDSLFFDIEKRFKDLEPDLALNEGGEWRIFDSQEETIRKSGEQGFLRYVSKKYAVPVMSLEPPPEKEYEYIFKKYSKKDVLLMYFCRQISQLQRAQGIKSFEEYMSGFLKYLKESGMPVSDEETELENLIKIYEEFFNEEFNWEGFEPKNVWPNYNRTLLNEISREVSLFRDKYIVNFIKEQLSKNDRIFVLIGVSHVIQQEPVLRYYFEE